MSARALVVGAALLVAAPAGAYVRSRTPHGTPVAWSGGCVFVQPDSMGSPDLTPDVVFTTIQKSMADWQTPTASCAYLVLKYDQPAPLEAHLDGKNVVKFRTDRWCHPEDPQNHNVCYDKAATAITTVFYVDNKGSAQDGDIMDADIELNDIDFTFVIEPSTTAAKPGTTIADLENTLTHELGHVQGLDHTCRDASTPSNEVDENGNPPPPCDNVPADEFVKVTSATMFASATPGETKKRSPEPDDIAGICAAYPIANANQHKSCSHTDLSSFTTSGCGILPHPVNAAGSGILWLLALLAVTGARSLLGRASRRSLARR